jgi:hypothetical protein
MQRHSSPSVLGFVHIGIWIGHRLWCWIDFHFDAKRNGIFTFYLLRSSLFILGRRLIHERGGGWAYIQALDWDGSPGHFAYPVCTSDNAGQRALNVRQFCLFVRNQIKQLLMREQHVGVVASIKFGIDNYIWRAKLLFRIGDLRPQGRAHRLETDTKALDLARSQFGCMLAQTSFLRSCW